jgi:hypothetical protein
VRRAAVVVTAFFVVTAVPALRGQLAVRVDDPLGLSLRTARVQVVHAPDTNTAGTSGSLIRRDPWLAYAMGAAYFEREWNSADGVFRGAGNRPIAAVVNSCAMCHNLPFRSAGCGGNAPDPAGYGRNAPHLFGIGLLETLAIQIRAQILARYDTNHNGFLDVPSETAGRHAIVEAAPGVPIDFGPLDDVDGDGLPDLNHVVRVIPVDRDGAVPPTSGVPPTLYDSRMAGYDIAVAFLSASVSDHQFPTVRAFTIGVMETLMGIPSIDPTTANDNGRGWAETSIAGAPQLAFPLRTPGASCAKLDHISEGELDLFEWYLLNQPVPGERAQSAATRHGRALMTTFGCTACHTAEWRIEPGDDARGLPGDRRFFDLRVRWNAPRQRLEGNLLPLTEARCVNGTTELVPRRGAYVVRDLFTDLRHHDVGARFYEYTYEEGHVIVTKQFRTPALWGVASTAPYGHDGRSMTLDDVIRRHGAEAERAADAYASASARDRRDLLAFLGSLVLYQPDTLPADLDGDGVIAADFRRGGLNLGPEEFRPELLFARPPRYRGWTESPEGDRYFSYALLNAAECYALDAEALADRDGDGIPDAVQCKRSTTETAAQATSNGRRY